MEPELSNILWKHQVEFHPVVPFDRLNERVVEINFTASNLELSTELIADTGRFSSWIEHHLVKNKARYGVGGYREKRILYKRSSLFEDKEPRCLHLGIDIWGAAGTPVMTPLGGMVHSFAFNDHFGDYGATIILQHQLETINFFTLYGHLSLADLGHIREGQFITRGETFAHFGKPEENGQWPPHLHIQVIADMGILQGDYPGVCKISEAAHYLSNSPDPSPLLTLH